MRILYADADIVVVDKPSGMLAVPGRGPDKLDSVVSRIRDAFPECIDYPAAHRLDMATSGLMVLALHRDALRQLTCQFEARTVHKEYEALLEGVVEETSGRIALSFRLDPDNRPWQVYDPVKGKLGVTVWEKVTVEDGCTRVAFTPLTGRTHQLRVHSAHPEGLGCPIMGDSLYGSGVEGDRMLLHAHTLRFTHPSTGEEMTMHSPTPF